jgi:hypothetical protein
MTRQRPKVATKNTQITHLRTYQPICHSTPSPHACTTHSHTASTHIHQPSLPTSHRRNELPATSICRSLQASGSSCGLKVRANSTQSPLLPYLSSFSQNQLLVSLHLAHLGNSSSAPAHLASTGYTVHATKWRLSLTWCILR